MLIKNLFILFSNIVTDKFNIPIKSVFISFSLYIWTCFISYISSNQKHKNNHFQLDRKVKGMTTMTISRKVEKIMCTLSLTCTPPWSIVTTPPPLPKCFTVMHSFCVQCHTHCIERCCVVLFTKYIGWCTSHLFVYSWWMCLINCCTQNALLSVFVCVRLLQRDQRMPLKFIKRNQNPSIFVHLQIAE